MSLMDIANCVSSQISSVYFSVCDPKDIKKLSVKRIINPQTLDSLDNPVKDGLYDPALGPCSKDSVCTTCGLTYFQCPGHFGHIELPLPVYNPLLFDQMFSLLRSVCLYCHKLKIGNLKKTKFAAKLILLQNGHLLPALDLDAHLEEHIMTQHLQQATKEKEKNKELNSADVDSEEMVQVIELYLAKYTPKRSKYFTLPEKTTAIADSTRRLLKEITKACHACRRCENCGGIAPTLRSENAVKIFKNALPQRYQKLMASQGKFTNDVIRQKKKKEPVEQNDLQEDLGINISDEELEETQNEGGDDMLYKNENQASYMTPLQVQEHFNLLWEHEKGFLDLVYGSLRVNPSKNAGPTHYYRKSSPDMFTIKYIAVPPCRFRPLSVLGAMKFDHAQNGYLSEILKLCLALRDIIHPEAKKESEQSTDNSIEEAVGKEESEVPGVIRTWMEIQQQVNAMIDSSLANSSKFGRDPPAGIKQVLEKKEGLFRKHMMGKRVNYAARSVISPDVNIETNEVGIPPVFAKKLTFPEPVTDHNVKDLREMVIKGPEEWPGATHVQLEHGVLTSLKFLSKEGRTALANQLMTPPSDKTFAGNPKKVYRHLLNGDMLLLNRQPTLHKPSIMAHKARILKGEKTIRMHYANCNTYNADFDGDEMNVHFPQNQLARAEAYEIARTDFQYLVPTNGGPLRGLIQDHVVSGSIMTSKDTFFNREDYLQIVYSALLPDTNDTCSKVVTIPPTLFKPQPLWTGKQVISTIIKNLTIGKQQLNLNSKAKIPGKFWGAGMKSKDSEEGAILIMDGELLYGIMDKSQFGASAFGLVHSCYEVYGATMAGELLSVLGRLFTKYLQSIAFSCRMDDLQLTPEFDKTRTKVLNESILAGRGVACKYVEHQDKGTEEDTKILKSKLEEVSRDDEKLKGLDGKMKEKMNKITSEVISKCIPGGLLKPFPANNMQMMTVSGAKGSNVNVSQISCCLGQQELEGRRVPLMISGKSLPSFLAYDSSARAGGYIAGRFLTGVKPQEYYFHCMAGREGLIDTAVKTSRSGYLQRCLIKHLEGLRVHYDNTVRDSEGSILQFHYGEDSLDVIKQKHINQFQFLAQNFEAIMEKYNPESLLRSVHEKEAVRYFRKNQGVENSLPTMSMFNSSRYLGACSDSFLQKVNEYIEKNPDGIIIEKKKASRLAKLKSGRFRNLMYLKYIKSLVDPGEAVGLLAAQSIGEPSTQMTLNTFHFAGFGAKNVTLGIPRLREIVMTASANIKTPTMILPLHDHVTSKEAAKFCIDHSRLTLASILKDVKVVEKLSSKSSENNFNRQKVFTVTLHFLPQTQFTNEYGVSPSHLKQTLEESFFKTLEKVINAEIRRLQKSLGVILSSVKKDKSKGDEDEDDREIATSKKSKKDDSDDEFEDVGDDAAAEIITDKKREKSSYDGPDEDDALIMTEMDAEEVDKAMSSDSEEESGEEEDAMEIEEDNKELSDRVRMECSNVDSVEFDRKTEWCKFVLKYPSSCKKFLLVEIIEKVADKVVLHEIPSINKISIMLNEKEGGDRALVTDGVNIQGFYDMQDVIDLNKVYSNDIASVLRNFGVEAARNAIIKEVGGVFEVYGIGVDHRHLTLIADYMTFEGGYKAFNRICIDSNPSPFAKMSFETTCGFLKKATINGDYDDLSNPSARLVMGRVVEGGTGCFDLLQPISV